MNGVARLFSIVKQLPAVGLGWLVLAASGSAADRLELVWPTPNPAWAEGKPMAAFLQHAGSGEPESGGFGGVRSGGTQFHEGIDLRAVAWDRRGEPVDAVFAALTGVVRHISAVAGTSSYGRYVVLEHPDVTPAVYTLYAHLARLAPELRVGLPVRAGQSLGTMGHSSGGYMIPKERAHLHFEIGVVMTHEFQAWYDRQKFGSRNEHGIWNGMNLAGIDPLGFFNEWRAGRVTTGQDYFGRMTTVIRLRIATFRTPDFVTRYPGLLTRPLPLGPVAGWEIRFNWTGVPFSWTPLSATEAAGLPADQVRILEVNAEIERRERSRNLAVNRRGAWAPGKDLEQALGLLFGPGAKM